MKLLALLTAVLLPVAYACGAQDPAAKPAASKTSADEALRVCTKCHDETEKAPVLAILKTKHAMMADKRTPFADQACMTCHGPSDKHLVKPPEGQKRALPDITFKAGRPVSSTEKNAVCLTCHESSLRLHWKGSQHEFRGLDCSSCHTVHTGQDPTLVKRTQPETCFACHKEKRAQVFRPSSHPIREGKVACSDCHNPHGSRGPKQLVKNSVNETCYTCHYEKRGPFLWEHAPVRDDCTNCHTPHGSIHPALLKTRVPWLCQQCHLAQFHPSTAYSGTGVPPQGAAQQLLAKGCLNCHSQVHGSNHPSGPRFTR
jgi:DmsE family decaheme c-type cytochrome